MSSASASGSVQWPTITPEFVYVVKLGDFQHVLRCADQKSSDHLGRAQMAVSDIDSARTLLTERGPFLLAEKQQKMDDLICDTEEAINRVIKALTPARVEQISDDSIRINTKSAWTLNTEEPKAAATFARLKLTHDKLKTVVHDLTNIKATAQLDNCEVRARVVPKNRDQTREIETGPPSTPSDDASMNWKQIGRLSKRTNTTDASSISRFSVTDGTIDFRSPVSNESTIRDFLSLAKTAPVHVDAAKGKLSIIHELDSTSLRSETGKSAQDAASSIAQDENEPPADAQNAKMGSFASYRRKNRDSYHEPQTPLLQTAKEIIFQRPGKPLSPIKDIPQDDLVKLEPNSIANGTQESSNGSTMPSQDVGTPIKGRADHTSSPVPEKPSPKPKSPIPTYKKPEPVLPRRLSTASKKVEVFTIDRKLERLPSLLRAGPRRPPTVQPPYPVSDVSEDEEEAPAPQKSYDGNRRNGRPAPITSPAGPTPPSRSNTEVLTTSTSPGLEQQQQHHRSYSDTSVPQIRVRAPTVPRKPLPHATYAAQAIANTRLQTTAEEPQPASRPVSGINRSISQAGTSGPPSPLDSIHSNILELRQSNVSLRSLSVQGPSSLSSSRRTSISDEMEVVQSSMQADRTDVATELEQTETGSLEKVEEPMPVLGQLQTPPDSELVRKRSREIVPNPLSMHPVKADDLKDIEDNREAASIEDTKTKETATEQNRRMSITPSTTSTVRTEQSAYQAQSATINSSKVAPTVQTQPQPQLPPQPASAHQRQVLTSPKSVAEQVVPPLSNTAPSQQISYSRFRDDDLRRPAPPRSVSDTVASIGSPYVPRVSTQPVHVQQPMILAPTRGQTQATPVQQQFIPAQAMQSGVGQVPNVPRTYASMSYIPGTMNGAATYAPQSKGARPIAQPVGPVNVANDGRRMSVPVMPSAATAVMQNGTGPRQEAKALFGSHVWSPTSVNGINQQQYASPAPVNGPNQQYAMRQPQNPGPTQAPWSQQQWRPVSNQASVVQQGQSGVPRYSFPVGANGYRQPGSQPVPTVYEGIQNQNTPSQQFEQLMAHQPGQTATRPAEPHRQHSCHCEEVPTMSGAVQTPQGQHQHHNHVHSQPHHHHTQSQPQPQSEARTASAYESAQSQPAQPHRNQTYPQLQPQPQSQPYSRAQTPQSAYQAPQSAHQAPSQRQVRLEPIPQGQVVKPPQFSSTYKSIDIQNGGNDRAASGPTKADEKQVMSNGHGKSDKAKTKKRASWLSHQYGKLKERT